MQKAGYKFLTAFIIIIFLFYWGINIPLSVTKNNQGNRFSKAFPLLNHLFGHTWNFFSGPLYNDDRIYCILRDKNTHTETDTLEMMADISNRKRSHIPFNQAENIIDHLVSHNLLIVKNGIRFYKMQLKQTSMGIADSAFNANVYNLLRNDKYYGQSLATMQNYCKMIIAEKKIDTVNKEFTIIMATKSIRPFMQRNNDKYVSKESIYFEMPYNTFNK
jgi:hypothetical protein